MSRSEMNAPNKIPAVCVVCGDSHVRPSADSLSNGRAEMCTSCPTPCESCRTPLGAFCAHTPCACACHAGHWLYTHWKVRVEEASAHARRAERVALLETVEALAEAPADVDVVNHPPHYTSHPSGVECITITESMGFCLGNAVKYIWRADLKHDDSLEDLEKARWYVSREIERRTKAAKAALEKTKLTRLPRKEGFTDG